MSDFYCRILLPGKLLASEKSEYQQIDIFQTGKGKALVLDGLIQFHTLDEFIYHEMSVHFPLFYHPNPERILVLGGGDGFILREVLKYQSVKEVVLVDLDGKVVELCKKHFAEENGGSLDNPKVKLIIDDALKYADTSAEKFDVVIMDLVDPYGPGAKLYAKETIEKFSKLLKEDGIISTHCEDSAFPNHVGLKMYSQLSKLFKHSKIGLAYMKSFDGLWTFVVLSNAELIPKNKETPQLKLRYFEPEKEPSYTKLPPFLEEKLKHYTENGFDKLAETPVLTRRMKLSDTLDSVLE